MRQKKNRGNIQVNVDRLDPRNNAKNCCRYKTKNTAKTHNKNISTIILAQGVNRCRCSV